MIHQVSKPSASGLAYARSACQRALAFFFEPQRGTETQLDLQRKAIGFELARAMEWPDAPDFDGVAAMVLTAPGVVTAIIQQTAALDRTSVTRGSNGQEIPIQPNSCRDAFRVYIHTGGRFAEVTSADLIAAVREAFERCKLPLPKGFPA